MNKIFYKVIIIFFLIAGFVLLLSDRSIWPDYYDLPYMGWASLACALAIILIPSKYKNPLALILLLNAMGDLGFYQLYRSGFEFDKVIHFLSSAVATYALAKNMKLRYAIIIVLSLSFGWELFEYLSDKFIKTHLFGVYSQQVIKDTILDTIMNLLGMTIALLIRRLYFHKNVLLS